MSLITSDNAHYAAIASAIRGKLGSQTTYKPSEMAAAINSIPTAGNNYVDFTEELINDYYYITAVKYNRATETIPYKAFSKNAHLSSIEWPSGLENIESYALMYCNFSNLELPDGLLTIGKGAFKYQQGAGLITLFIPSSVTTIESTAIDSIVTANSNLEIYTDAPSKPEGWSQYFCNNSETTTIPVHYGVTRAEYREIVGGS